jgi:hypothetical protein
MRGYAAIRGYPVMRGYPAHPNDGGIKMTNEQINIAIAELTGLAVIHDPAGPKDCPEAWKTGFFTPKAAKQRRISWPSSGVIKVVPNYCNDLNAMSQAEEVLSEDQWIDYMLHLQGVLVRHPNRDKWTVCRELMHATARQRAEAFLRTLNLWKD